MVILNNFEIPAADSFNLIQRFGKRYLCTREEKVMNFCANGVQLFDISSGESVYKFETANLLQLFSFNWSLEELAVVIGDHSQYRPDFFPKILKTGFFKRSGTNLKQWARLTCLKHFDEEYLKENLPNCLCIWLNFQT